MIVELPIKTVSEMNVRVHWGVRAARAKGHRLAAWTLAPRTDLPCVVKMTRLSPGTLDDDNLRSALKAARDGIADKLGVKDNDPAVQWKYEQEKCKRGHFGVRVEIVSL